MIIRFAPLLFFCCILTISCSQHHNMPVSTTPVNQEVLAEGFEVPYDIAVIDEDQFLVTERMGGVYLYQRGEVTEISGIPQSQTFLADRHYGGMMAVSLHPDFANNQLVYLSYVNPAYTLSVSRFRLSGTSAEDLEEIFTSSQFCIGTRIVWEDNDHFFLSFGVGGAPKPEPGPQDLSDPRGKIFRFHADGSVPDDNPVFSDPNALPGIWSYGHRDPQGLVYDKSTGILYSTEHGPMGGDELNIIEKGGNYGWPLFSYGLNYDGSRVSDMSEEEAKESTIMPMKYWTPDFRLAPGNLFFTRDSNITEWNNQFIISALLYQELVGYNPENDSTQILIPKAGRIREIAQLPSGNLVILVEQHSPAAGFSGRIIKLTPQ